MDHFNYREDQLFAEQVAVDQLADQFGTPLYVYSRATFERHFLAYTKPLIERNQDHLICYAVKANSNIAVLNILAKLGAGFDIVSQGELERVLAAGGDPATVVFSGVGKTADDMTRAIEVGVHCFNVESKPELALLQHVAKELDKAVNISIRVNPDVDAKTHPYISTGLKENKFGIEIDQAIEVYQQAAKASHLNVVGIDCHIGSQLTENAPFLDALDRVIDLADQLAKLDIQIKHLDLGGGLGVPYDNETPPLPEEYMEAILERLGDRKFKLIFEPGRSIAANAGIFVTEVLYLKQNAEKDFAIIDGAMNDLLRPALYSAWQKIIPVKPREGESRNYDIVGPVCETGDFIGKDRSLCLQSGDRLAVRSAGAYGFTMASNYNSRNRAAEVMVDGDQAHLIRRRETFQEQFSQEQCLPE